MPADMLLLVGLGNPGDKYARHRHNVGFMAVDAIANANAFGPAKSKFQGEIREGFLEGPAGRRKAMTLKPVTYMNDSGRSVQEAARFYKIDLGDVIVFHDELDLAAGKVKTKTGGGTAGHNGLRSIEAHLGNGFQRVRIGIGHPGEKSRVTGHVLGDFAKSDYDWLDPLLNAVAAAAPALTESGARFTTQLALQLAPPKEKSKDVEKNHTAPRPASEPKDAKTDSNGGPFSALHKLFKPKE